MGVGYGKGEDRFKQALARATQNQLLETTIDGAKIVLVQYFGDKLDMMEISRCGDEICEKADPNVDIIFGTREPEEDNDDMRDFVYITIIAADFSAKEQPSEASFTGAINTDTFGVKPSQNAFQANFGQVLNTPPQQPQQQTPPQQPKPQDNGNGDDDIPSFLRARK